MTSANVGSPSVLESLLRALDYRSGGFYSLGLFFSFILSVWEELLLFPGDIPGPALVRLPPTVS